MTLRASARRCAGTFRVRHQEGLGGTVLDARRMSTSTGAYGLAAPTRKKPSRKVIPRNFLGSAAVAGLVLGCAWTVYSNVFGASIYPSVNSAAFEAPVVKRPAVAVRSTQPAFNDVFAALADPAPVISKPETVAAITPFMFNER